MAINLTSKTARLRLLPRREPYWSKVQKGLFLGYRSIEAGAGTWVGRRLRTGGVGDCLEGNYVTRSFGPLADHDAAMRALTQWAGDIDAGAAHRSVTVSDVCRAYVSRQRTAKGAKSSADAEARFRRLVYSAPIGNIQLDRLRTSDLRKWIDAQLDEGGDDEYLRRSKDSANRNLASLKAAFNLALRDRLVATDAGWATVVPFSKVGRRRELFLDKTQRSALLAACEPDLRILVTGLLLTAARPGELAACTVADFDSGQGTLALHGKTGRRVVAISTAARSLFVEQTRNKPPSVPLLITGYGTAWNKDNWKDRLKVAARAAGLPESTVAYTLRHVAISELIMAGVDSLLVARTAGTSVAMIERHYAHLRLDQTRERLDRVQMF